MRDNTIIYRVLSLDGETLLIGSAKDVCEYTGVRDTSQVNRYVEYSSVCLGEYRIEMVGIYRRIFAISGNDGKVFVGTLDDISNKLYVNKNSIKNHTKHGTKLLNEYTVEELEGKVESYVDY